MRHSVGYRVRTWRWRRYWQRRERAQWPKPPSEYQLQRFWNRVVRETRDEREHTLESHNLD